MVMAREDWLKAWGYVDGTPEAEVAWIDKQSFDARQITAPMVMSDYIDPVLSHADGKTYDSKSSLFKSYRADGNPQGVAYECIGERVAEPFKRPTRDKEKAMQAVKRVVEEMGI